MRKLLVIVASLALVLGMSGGAVAAKSSTTTRIALAHGDAKANGVGIRHQLMGGQVSADVTEAQLANLQRKGVAFRTVPKRTVDGTGAAAVRTATPVPQIPYGIKMAYGDPNLTTANINGGAGVTVAVLDTGVLTTHVDFVRADGSNVITDCVNFADPSTDVITGQCADGHGHGTHVTGTVAAAGGLDGKGIFGMAPQASILAYKVLDNSGNGYADDVARAITYAADHGANIISMSLGFTGSDPAELAAVQYAVSQGVLVIAAAGNQSYVGSVMYPAAYKEVVAVASLNRNESVLTSSSRGTTDGDNTSIADGEVEVAATGEYVLSTYKDGGYYRMTGTSMAAPHIAGLAAKMWQGSGTATRAWLQNRAVAHDIVKGYITAVGYDQAAGYGMPQVTTRSLATWFE